MDLSKLPSRSPHKWPPNAPAAILRTLRDEAAGDAERLLAAELAEALADEHDDLAWALINVLDDPRESEELRAQAAASLSSAVIEWVIRTGMIGRPPDPPPTEAQVRASELIDRIYLDETAPELVRRRALESSVRAEREWHRNAVLEAWASDDLDWRVTALTCMGFLEEFDEVILDSLASECPRTLEAAVGAAGERGLREAWPRIRAILTDPSPERSLFLTAIHAAAEAHPRPALPFLHPLVHSDDPEIAWTARGSFVVALLCSGTLFEPEGDIRLDDLESQFPAHVLRNGSRRS